MPRSKNLEKVAYHYLKEQIQSKEWLPQTHITEQKISTCLGISRTPIRNAFLKLQEEGYLTIIPHKGAVVTEPKIKFKEYADRLEYIELMIVHQLHFIELKEIQLDFPKLDCLLNQMIACIEQGDVQLYDEKERQLIRVFLQSGKNDYMMSSVMDTIRSLHQQKASELACILKKNIPKKIHHYSLIVDLLRKRQFGLARKQVRIAVNQLVLSVLND